MKVAEKSKGREKSRAPVQAAGGIVVRDAGAPLIAVVRLRKDNAWVLPKGKLKPGENALAAAKREVVEETGHDVEVHKHSFAGNGRAMIVGDTEGLVKVVAAKDGPILGLHLVGPWASELLHEGYLAVNWDALPSDVGLLIHAHPSLSEAIGETMITFSGRSLHG